MGEMTIIQGRAFRHKGSYLILSEDGSDIHSPNASSERMNRVLVTGKGCAVSLDDVRNLKLDRFQILSAGKEIPMVLNDVRGAAILNSKGPAGVPKWIRKQGDTKGVTVR